MISLLHLAKIGVLEIVEWIHERDVSLVDAYESSNQFY